MNIPGQYDCTTVIPRFENNNKLFMTPKEFSKDYGIGINKTYELVNYKSFPKVKNGNRILILRSKVEDWFINNLGVEF